MEARTRVVVTAVALFAVLGIGWLLLGSDLPPAPSTPPTPAEPAQASQPALPATADATPAAPVEATAVDEGAEAMARVAVPVVDAKLATLRGRCVDEHGAPLAGCRVSLHGWEDNDVRLSAWLKDHAEAPAWKDPPALTTTADGVFVFTFWPPPPFQFGIDVRIEGRGAKSGRWSAIAEGSTKDVGDVSLHPGVHVSGRVVDEQGAPQETEYVTLQRERVGRMGDGMEERWGDQVVSKADGSFVLRDWIAPGEYTIRTQVSELQSPKSVQLTTDRPEEVLTIVVRKATAADLIRGRVVDEAGTPVRGVEVVDRMSRGYGRTITGRDGTFQLERRGSDRQENASLVVSSRLYEVDDKPREIAWGTNDVEFRVKKAPALTLRVTDQQGAPVDSYLVRLLPRSRNGFSSLDNEPRAQGHHEDGTVVIPGLTRGDWLLMVEFATASGLGGLFHEFTQEAGDQRFDLRAEAMLRRSLQVVGPDGPIAGTTVQLCSLFGKPLADSRLVMSRQQWLWNAGGRHALVLWEGATNEAGRVELVGPRGGDLGVCVLGPGHVPVRHSPVSLESAEELVVTVGRGAQLVASVVPPEALAELKRLAGAEAGQGFSEDNAPHVTLRRDRESFPKDHVSARGKKDLRIRDDGTFRVEGLPPGTWQVHVGYWVAHKGGASSRSLPADHVTLVDGATTTIELDLSGLLPGEVQGTVHWNGQPLGNDEFVLEGAGNGSTVRTDAEGRFRATVLPGDYKAVVNRQTGDRRDPHQWTSIRCVTPIVVTRGQLTSVALQFASSTIHATVLDPKGKPVAGVELHALGSERNGARSTTDAKGIVSLELTTDTVQLRVLPKSLSTPEAQQKLWEESRGSGIRDPMAQHWIVLQTVALVAGQTSTIEVRLPESAGY